MATIHDPAYRLGRILGSVGAPFCWVWDGSLEGRFYAVSEKTLFGAAVVGGVASLAHLIMERTRVAMLLGTLSGACAMGGVVARSARQQTTYEETVMRQEASHQRVVTAYKNENLAQKAQIEQLAAKIEQFATLEDRLEKEIEGLKEERKSLKMCVAELIKHKEGEQAKNLTAVEALIQERRSELASLEIKITSTCEQLDSVKEEHKKCNVEHKALLEAQKKENENLKASNLALRKTIQELNFALTGRLTGP